MVRRNIQKGFSSGIVQKELQCIQPSYKIRFKIILHSVGKKEEVSFKRKGPSLNSRCSIAKYRSIHLLPRGSCKHFKEERPIKVGSSSCNQLREIEIVLKCDVDGLPALLTELAITEKMIPSFQ
jgi:hypothetical protein